MKVIRAAQLTLGVLDILTGLSMLWLASLAAVFGGAVGADDPENIAGVIAGIFFIITGSILMAYWQKQKPALEWGSLILPAIVFVIGLVLR